MGKQRFFKCSHCGNLAGLIQDHRVPMVCCGEPMAELVPNTVEASVEKHLPEVVVSGDKLSVQVGSVLHPMQEDHNIPFVYVETEQGGQRKCLKVGAEPKAEFCLVGDKAIAVYAYCNLHGLWKTEL
ncbi:MAG: desulfoferrodoxin [Oscillospiraceae bacterium]|nr:desulfoferrodoxin [Oscillospiraceae bacterium]